MKEDYYHLTKNCLWIKDEMVDSFQRDYLCDLRDFGIEIKCDYKKEMDDINKVMAIKKSIIDASLNFDKLLHKFNLDKQKVLFQSYDNYSKNLNIICDTYKICKDIQNIILHFLIDKRYYNSEIRKIRKNKKLLSNNINDKNTSIDI